MLLCAMAGQELECLQRNPATVLNVRGAGDFVLALCKPNQFLSLNLQQAFNSGFSCITVVPGSSLCSVLYDHLNIQADHNLPHVLCDLEYNLSFSIRVSHMHLVSQCSCRNLDNGPFKTGAPVNFPCDLTWTKVLRECR